MMKHSRLALLTALAMATPLADALSYAMASEQTLGLALGHALNHLPPLAAPACVGSFGLFGAVTTMCGLRDTSADSLDDALPKISLPPPMVASDQSTHDQFFDCGTWRDAMDAWRGFEDTQPSPSRVAEPGKRQRESAEIYALAAAGEVDESYKRLYAMLRSEGDDPAISTCNAVLFALARAERPDDAASLLEALPRANAASHNALLHAYARARRRDDALRVLAGMTARAEADIVSYGCVMNACARSGDIAACETLHARLLAERAAWRAEVVSCGKAAVWRGFYSHEHQQWFYENIRTHHTTWELPSDAVAGDIEYVTGDAGETAAKTAAASSSSRLAPNDFTFGALIHACAEAAVRTRARGVDDSDVVATASRWFREGRAEVAARGGPEAEEKFVRKMIRLHDTRLLRTLSKQAALETQSAAVARPSSATPRHTGVSSAAAPQWKRGLLGVRRSAAARSRLQTALAAEAAREDGDGGARGGGRSSAARRRQAPRRKQQTRLSAGSAKKK